MGHSWKGIQKWWNSGTRVALESDGQNSGRRQKWLWEEKNLDMQGGIGRWIEREGRVVEEVHETW